jgi:uncharacterized LabA/DUF88 family protein
LRSPIGRLHKKKQKATTENALRVNHYEVALLVSGDGDYVPVVRAVKQQGKRVVCLAFEGLGVSQELKLACDEYFDLSQRFESDWEQLSKMIPA